MYVELGNDRNQLLEQDKRQEVGFDRGKSPRGPTNRNVSNVAQSKIRRRVWLEDFAGIELMEKVILM